jgi:aminotransferase
VSAHNFLSHSSDRIDTSQIRRVFQLASKLKNPINLSIGQPDFPVPLAVIESYKSALDAGHTGYTLTQGLPELREEISKNWLEKTKVNIQPEHILVSTGVASLLHLLFMTIFNPGDKIILIEPYFLIYKSLADYHQLDCIYLHESFSEPEIYDLLKNEEVGSIKAALYSTPSNPTGKILSREQIEQLGKYADQLDFLLISDEIYELFDYEEKFISTSQVVPERTITLNGFSKSHSMTGLRVGYAGVTPNLAPIIDKMSTIQQYSVVCCPHPAQVASITALHTSMKNELRIMKERRDALLKHLLPMGLEPNLDGAFYAYLPVPVSGKEFTEKAIENELLIVPGEIFEREGKTVRISYAQPLDVIAKGIGIFKKLYESMA